MIKDVYLQSVEDDELLPYEYYVALIELMEPFELGVKTDIYPGCLHDGRLTEFNGRLLFAAYGLTEMMENTDFNNSIMSGLDKERLDGHFLINNNLWLIKNLVHIKTTGCCEELICARSTHSSTCLYDFGGGLIYAHSHKLHIVGILIEAESKASIFCAPNTTSYYAPIYSNLNFINNYTKGERCFTKKFLTHHLYVLYALAGLSVACFLISFILYQVQRCVDFRESSGDSDSDETESESSSSAARFDNVVHSQNSMRQDKAGNTRIDDDLNTDKKLDHLFVPRDD